MATVLVEVPYFLGRRGGLTAVEVAAGVAEVARRFTIRAAALTAYEPAYDTDATIPAAAALIARQIVGAGVPA